VTLRLVGAPPLPRMSEPQWVERAWQGTKRELLGLASIEVFILAMTLTHPRL